MFQNMYIWCAICRLSTCNERGCGLHRQVPGPSRWPGPTRRSCWKSASSNSRPRQTSRLGAAPAGCPSWSPGSWSRCRKRLSLGPRGPQMSWRRLHHWISHLWRSQTFSPSSPQRPGMQDSWEVFTLIFFFKEKKQKNKWTFNINKVNDYQSRTQDYSLVFWSSTMDCPIPFETQI